jgi:2-octaprenyl-6-methoxyphenol hydroxylase
LGATVYYDDLVHALTAAVNAQPQIAWRRPARIAAIEQSPGNVVVRLVQGETLRACCVVHAEGRADSGMQREQGPAAVIADIQLAGPPADAAFERFTRAGPLALLPAPALAGTPTWGLVWCVEDESAAQRWAALGDAEFVRRLQAQLGSRRAQVTHAGRRRVVFLPAQARARVHAFRQIWLGNAAQTLHPVAGQGFNLGVRDVAVLAECLAAARSGPATIPPGAVTTVAVGSAADAASTATTAAAAISGAVSDERFCANIPAALARYARRRAGDRAAIGAVTRWLPAVFATRFAPIAAARGAALGALDLLPPLRRQWTHLLMFGVRS